MLSDIPGLINIKYRYEGVIQVKVRRETKLVLVMIKYKSFTDLTVALFDAMFLN